MKTPIYLPASKLTQPELMSRIFANYNRIKAYAKKNTGAIDPKRLDRALGIAQSGGLQQEDVDLYAPTLTSCGCKDQQFASKFHRLPNYGGPSASPCKHRLAIWLLEPVETTMEYHNGGK